MYKAKDSRYDSMQYQRCGNSGLKLPRVALGLWHNFGTNDDFENQTQMVYTAFDAGITHFDLANNYGPVAGSAEENFGRILASDMKPYRDEMIISSKAGFDMWPGPYGDLGSRKHLMASCEQSLKRLNIDYLDIFYHHRPDPDTPIEETMNALSDIVKSGKALYVGISNYNAEQAVQAAKILKANGTPLLVNQVRYNMLDRWIEKNGLLDTLSGLDAGCVCFSPLAQGLLTTKYFHGIPAGSRASLNKFLRETDVTQELVAKITRLNDVAHSRGQTLAQLALSWVLRKNRVTTVLIGASKPIQISKNCGIVQNLEFSNKELDDIEAILD
ncbi:MAG TPA: aldo/keto reductase [Treponemataceae bacterium]|nr:aldo/keto reductase [Treponemataceae bacterium]